MATESATYNLDDRQWVQVKAALTLWLTVARNSNTHPSRHSNIEPLFAEHAPLDTTELEALIEGMEYPPYITTGQFADVAGVTRQTVGNWIRRGDVTPAFRHGNNCIYRTMDLLKLEETYGRQTVHRD